MTFLIEKQIYVCNFSVVWGFSWGWGWNMNNLHVFFFIFKKTGIFYSNSLLPIENISRKYVREIAHFLFRFPSALQHCERCSHVLFILYEGQFSSFIHSFNGTISLTLQFSVFWYCDWILSLQLPLRPGVFFVLLLDFLFVSLVFMACCLWFCFFSLGRSRDTELQEKYSMPTVTLWNKGMN